MRPNWLYAMSKSLPVTLLEHLRPLLATRNEFSIIVGALYDVFRRALWGKRLCLSHKQVIPLTDRGSSMRVRCGKKGVWECTYVVREG